MAHLIKSTRGATGGLTRHFERYKNKDGKYIHFGNQEIDINKCHLNYNLAEEKNQMEFIKNRTSEVICLNRKDVNIMCSWIITLPEDIKNREEQDLFFKESYSFLENLYGKENVISSFVHLDETTPHMHFAFIPVVYDKNKENYKVSAKELINRKHLQEFHPKLESHMTKIFNRDIGILNEVTKDGNKSIDELKRTSADKELKALKSSVRTFKKELDMITYSKDKIKAIDEIEAKKPILNKDSVQIKQEDFDRLIYIAKNYIKDTEYLRNENFKLKKDIKFLNEKLKEKEQKFNLEDLSKEVKTKSKIYNLENKVDKLSNFIIEKGLTDEFNESIRVVNRDHDLEK